MSPVRDAQFEEGGWGGGCRQFTASGQMAVPCVALHICARRDRGKNHLKCAPHHSYIVDGKHAIGLRALCATKGGAGRVAVAARAAWRAAALPGGQRRCLGKTVDAHGDGAPLNLGVVHRLDGRLGGVSGLEAHGAKAPAAVEPCPGWGQNRRGRAARAMGSLERAGVQSYGANLERPLLS